MKIKSKTYLHHVSRQMRQVLTSNLLSATKDPAYARVAEQSDTLEKRIVNTTCNKNDSDSLTNKNFQFPEKQHLPNVKIGETCEMNKGSEQTDSIDSRREQGKEKRMVLY